MPDFHRAMGRNPRDAHGVEQARIVFPPAVAARQANRPHTRFFSISGMSSE